MEQHGIAVCPACGAEMDERKALDVMIDVCPKCRGLWIDWFDGDTLEVAVKAAPLSMRAPVAIDLTKAHCPRCKKLMAYTNHARIEDAQGELGDLGVPLLKCADCGGTFVPRTVFEEILELADPPSEEGVAPTPMGKLRRILRNLFAAPR